MRSSQQISELRLDNSSRVVNKTVLDDIPRIQRIVCVILTLSYLFIASEPSSAVLPSPSLFRVMGYGILFLLFLIRPKRNLRFLLSNKLLFALVVFATASVIWSSYPSETISNSRALIRSYLFAGYFVSMYSVRDQVKLIQYTFVAALIASVFVALLMPEIGVHAPNGSAAWRGIYNHKQSFAMIVLLCSTTFSPFIIRSKSKIEFYLSCLGLLFCFLVAYQVASKTAFILILFVVLILPFYVLLSYAYNSGLKLRSLFLIISALVLLSFFALIFGNFETIFVDILGKGTDFNGRVPLWILCLEEAVKKPILGYGYYGFWPSDEGLSVAYRTSWMSQALYDTEFWNPGEPFSWHAHSGLVQTFLDLGIIGLVLVLLNLGHTILKIFSKLKINQFSTSYYSTELHWFFLILSLMLLLSVTETHLLRGNNIFWLSYMIIAINVSARKV